MPEDVDRVMDLAKRRGFLWPSYEVYGGLAGFYDYGPYGAAMKTRFEALWRHVFLTSAVAMAEIACPRVTPHDVLKASGHVDEFTDLVVRCKQGHPQRADHLVEAAGFEGNADALTSAQIDQEIAARAPKCPVCGDKTWTAAAPMNLMFQTEIGPGSGRVGYLRPETAQGIFTDFPHMLRHFRGKLPFGVIQLGGSNRNEISPRQGMLRLREFHMMEAEVFFEDTSGTFAPLHDDPRCDVEAAFVDGEGHGRSMTFRAAAASGLVGTDGQGNEPLAYFLALTHDFLVRAGMDPGRLRFRQHEADEMAHYASDCWDAEFHSARYGWVECVGVADRGCYDLTQHAVHSGKKGDFQVHAAFDAPFTFQATRRVPVMGVLGKTFRGDAKAIAAALERAFEEEMHRALQDDERFPAAWLGEELVLQEPGPPGPADGACKVHLDDGREVEVPADGFQVVAGDWQATGRRLIPRVIEPSFGVDRILWALWEHAYEAGEKNGEPYVRMRLSPHVAPVQVAVLPLTSKGGQPETAAAIEADLRASGYRTETDESGNIGRRYARQDEVGTPFCVTVDDETAEDASVTVRERDTTRQERVPIARLAAYLEARFSTGATA